MSVLVVALVCSHSLSTCFPKNFCWVIIFYTPCTVFNKNQPHAVKRKSGRSISSQPLATWPLASNVHHELGFISVPGLTSVDYELSGFASGCRARLHLDSASLRVDAIIHPSLVQTMCLPGNKSQQASQSCGSCWHNTRKTEVLFNI